MPELPPSIVSPHPAPATAAHSTFQRDTSSSVPKGSSQGIPTASAPAPACRGCHGHQHRPCWAQQLGPAPHVAPGRLPRCEDAPHAVPMPTVLHRMPPRPSHPHSQAAGEAGAFLHWGHDGIVEAIGSNTTAQGLGSLGMRAKSGQGAGQPKDCPHLPKHPWMNLSVVSQHCVTMLRSLTSAPAAAREHTHSLPTNSHSWLPLQELTPTLTLYTTLPLQNPVSGHICPKELE